MACRCGCMNPNAEGLWLGAAEFDAVIDLITPAPTPILGVVGALLPAWIMPAGLTPRTIATTVNVAELTGWSTFDFEIIWTNAGIGAGDALLQGAAIQYAAGSDLSDVVTTGYFESQAATAAAQNIAVVSSLAGIPVIPLTPGPVPVPASGFFEIAVQRQPGFPEDTLLNDIGIIACRLVKVS